MEKYIGFWKPTGKYGFLCQWWKCKFSDGTYTFNCTEQYMMAQKAILFGDNETLKEILAETEPYKMKAYGRKIKNFSEEIWNDNKKKIVYIGNYMKFTQNTQLRNKLINTYGSILVEASPYDTVWGVGTDDYSHPSNWKGQNLLGDILMEVRDYLVHTTFTNDGDVRENQDENHGEDHGEDRDDVHNVKK